MGRVDRLNALFLEELAQAVSEFFPREEGLATISAVEVTKDLSQANVWIAFIGGKRPPEELLAMLEEKRGEVQEKLSRKLCLRRFPRLLFQIARGGQNLERVSHILEKEKA